MNVEDSIQFLGCGQSFQSKVLEHIDLVKVMFDSEIYLSVQVDLD